MRKEKTNSRLEKIRSDFVVLIHANCWTKKRNAQERNTAKTPISAPSNLMMVGSTVRAIGKLVMVPMIKMIPR